MFHFAGTRLGFVWHTARFIGAMDETASLQHYIAAQGLAESPVRLSPSPNVPVLIVDAACDSSDCGT